MIARWETKTLGDVLEKTDTINPLQYPDREFDYIDVSSVSNQTFEIEEVQRIKGSDAPSRARKRVKANDIIFATIRPTLQRIAVVPQHLNNQVCSTGYFVLRPKPGIDSRFIFYSLFTEDFMERMQTLQKGASYPAVTDGDVKGHSISIPPFPEQQRIAGLLDEAFENVATAKANAEKNLQNARELFESYLQGVDADKVSLGSLVNITTGKLDANAAVEGGRYPFFTCSRDVYAIDKYAFDCEAILLAGNNAVGDFNVKHYRGKFNAYQRTYVITVNTQKRVNYRFLYFQLLKSLKKFKAQSVGAGTKFLKLGMIKDLEIALPTLVEQDRVVATFDNLRDETERLENINQERLGALAALKQSMLHQAFAGNL